MKFPNCPSNREADEKAIMSLFGIGSVSEPDGKASLENEAKSGNPLHISIAPGVEKISRRPALAVIAPSYFFAQHTSCWAITFSPTGTHSTNICYANEVSLQSCKKK